MIVVTVAVAVVVLQPETSWGNASTCRTAWIGAPPGAFSSHSARRHPRCATQHGGPDKCTARAHSVPCFVSFHCVLFGSVPCSKFFYRFLAGAVQMLHQALAHPTSTKTYVTIVRGSGEAFVDRGWFTASVYSYISLSFLIWFSFYIFVFLAQQYFFSVVLFLVFR